MNRCIICGEQGERHHIVYKNQGGIDIPTNYIYLCSIHHRGEEGPHKNREMDLKLKKDMQEKLFDILIKDYYNLEEIAKLLKVNPMQLKIVSKDFKQYKLGYKKIEVIKRIMGGKLYK